MKIAWRLNLMLIVEKVFPILIGKSCDLLQFQQITSSILVIFNVHSKIGRARGNDRIELRYHFYLNVLT